MHYIFKNYTKLINNKAIMRVRYIFQMSIVASIVMKKQFIFLIWFIRFYV